MATVQVNQPHNTPDVIDVTSPLYMHPSENDGSTLLPVVFDGNGYRSWKRSVLRALSMKNKTGFINEKCKRPTEDSPILTHWERCDDMVTSWLLNSLSKDLADSLQCVNNAQELWQELEDRYYTKMKRIWVELGTIDASTSCSCECTCGAKASLHKAEQARRLIQFLMGLNEVYTIVRGLVQVSIISNSVGNNYGNHYGASGSIMNRGGYGNRVNLFYEYCKKPGQLKEKCYKLHGFPPDFKFSKGKNTTSAANTHITNGDSSDGKLTSTHGHGDDIPSSHNLTQDQYNQLMQLLRNFSVVDTAGHDLNCFVSEAVNLAGILACHSSMTEIGNLSCACKTLSADSWILDSGASHHMTYKKDLLTNIVILPYPFLVSLPNSYKVKVTEVGDVHLGSALTLCRAPSLKRPLVIGKASDGL
ncbi:uncharacterized protein LOC124898408 [Capsicum annuum]|uniref:uncharacterized protein LOC124898408 n=1 Tax=Capsicum annuum TaxID=4072 RepID=UPI001FB1459F|nr:uncharacterized protein LOC124898408 [Capsicum annuum]